MSNRMFSVLGIARNDIAALQEVPADILLRCGNQIMSEASGTGHSALKYAPVIDGRSLPEEPWRTGAPEGAKHIPLIIGSTLDETIIYTSGNNPAEDSIAKAIVTAATVYTPDETRVAELVPVYRRALPALSNAELVVRISTDIGFWKNAVHQAEMHSKAGAPVYMYRCDWKTPCFEGAWAPHGVELPLVMGHKRYGAAWDGKDTEARREAADPENLRFELGDRMLAAWVKFAEIGNPALPGFAWPAYDVKARSTMIFDRETMVVDDPSGEFRTLVSAV